MGDSWGEVEDYAALAKSGGRRDLLVHHENIRDPNSKAIEVPPSVEWFAHEDTPKKSRGTPHESIHKNHWSQWNTDVPKLPAISSKSTVEPPKKKENLKLPSLSPNKDHVDMRKLLALDYQKEWLDIRKAKMRMERERLRAKREARRRKMEEHAMKTRKINVDKMEKEKQPRKISTTLKLPPL